MRFNPDEASALQHAYNLKINHPLTFDAEHQNDPPKSSEDRLLIVTLIHLLQNQLADGLRAAAANSRTVRRTLRNRARYEVANNSYAKGFIATFVNEIVGLGRILRVAAGAAEANTRIERAFSNWAIEIGLAQKLRTMRQSNATDDEAFAMLVTNEALCCPTEPDLKLIEADQVTDLDDSQGNADGIRFDQHGNPASYTVLREHPGIEDADADFDMLGVQMRGYFDFAVAKQEWRAGVNNKGPA